MRASEDRIYSGDDALKPQEEVYDVNLDWRLQVNEISSLPIHEFNSKEASDDANETFVSIYAEGSDYSIDEECKLIANRFIETLYIDFEQWTELNEN